ncbi:MAG TPA: DJ-1/PfpI family protein [Jatrophihabitantaceae bacterium]|jgi:putative intracellular protease/amidase
MTGTRTVHLAVYETLADWETGYAAAFIASPWWMGSQWPWQLRTVAETAQPITTVGGLRIVPDLALSDLRPSDSELLILPGAHLWDVGGGAAFTSAARAFLDAGVPVAAICGATFGLARDGLLDDRAHTSSALSYLEPSGYAGAAHYVDEPAVTDGDLITAGPTNPIEFARAIFTRLDLFGEKATDAWYRLFKHSDPAAYYELASA